MKNKNISSKLFEYDKQLKENKEYYKCEFVSCKFSGNASELIAHHKEYGHDKFSLYKNGIKTKIKLAIT